MRRILLFLLLIVGQTCWAQFETNEQTTSPTTSDNSKIKKHKDPLKEKIVVGGGFDLQFGNTTVVGLTPLAAYAVTDDFLLGGIFTYRYFQDNRTNYSTSTYGIAPFARYFVYKGLFAHAEYEMLNGEFYYNQGHVWVNSMFLGFGYASRIGSKGFVGFYALWNLTEQENYIIYNQPTFRINFGIGL